MARIIISSCFNMTRSRYTMQVSRLAAVAIGVAVAVVPVWADTAQEKVISRLLSETSTGARAIKDALKPGTTTSLQVSQSLEQKREEIRKRLHGN